MSAVNLELYTVSSGSDGFEELVTFNLQTQTIRTVPLLGVPADGRDLALAYRPVDDSLYLLDEVTGERGKPALRLLQISRSGVAAELARIRRGSGVRDVHLTTTHEGLLVLSFSGAGGGGLGHPQFVLLEPVTGGIEVVGIYRDPEPGGLPIAPGTLSRAAFAVAKLLPPGGSSGRSAKDAQGGGRIDFVEIPRAAFSAPANRSLEQLLDGLL